MSMFAETVKGSEARLWRLIEARCQPGADIERIDERIWDLFGENWAVMFTDLVGFSRHVAAFGITHFLQIIHESQKLLIPVIDDHDGILLEAEADSLLIIFKRVEKAIRCAVAMERVCQNFSATRAPESQIQLCVGIGYGRILRFGDDRVAGGEVNTASKLGEDTAKAHEVMLTESAHAEAGPIEGLDYKLSEVSVSGSEKSYYVIY